MMPMTRLGLKSRKSRNPRTRIASANSEESGETASSTPSRGGQTLSPASSQKHRELMAQHDRDAGKQGAYRRDELAGYPVDGIPFEAIQRRRHQPPAGPDDMPHVTAADISLADLAQVQSGAPSADKLRERNRADEVGGQNHDQDLLIHNVTSLL